MEALKDKMKANEQTKRGRGGDMVKGIHTMEPTCDVPQTANTDKERDNETYRTASITSFHSIPSSLVEVQLIGSSNNSKNVRPAGWDKYTGVDKVATRKDLAQG